MPAHALNCTAFNSHAVPSFALALCGRRRLAIPLLGGQGEGKGGGYGAQGETEMPPVINVAMLERAGFITTSQWSDEGFALTLAAAR